MSQEYQDRVQQHVNASGVLVIEWRKDITIVAHHENVYEFANTIRDRKKDQFVKFIQPRTLRPNPGTLQTWVQQECEYWREMRPDCNVDLEYKLRTPEYH